jgi:hypothetical protein
MLGFSTFSEFPFATVAKDNNVTITVTGNALTVSFGNPGITADAIVEIPDPNQVTLGIGTVTITADANLSVTGNALTLGTGTVTVTADANMYPSGNGLAISSGTVTITGDANVSSTGNALTLGTGTAQAITWSAIVPGVSMVWTPIDPS